MRHQLLYHIQLRIDSHLHNCLPECRIHAFDLRRIQCKYRVLLQINLRHRIQHLCTCSFAFSVMLLFITHIRALPYMEGMNPIMPALVAATVMNTAACDNRHICTLVNVEVVVNHIMHPGRIHHYRYMHLFSLRLSVYENVNPLLIFFLLNLDMLAVSMTECDAVMPKIERSLLLEFFPIYLFQYLLCNLI